MLPQEMKPALPETNNPALQETTPPNPALRLLQSLRLRQMLPRVMQETIRLQNAVRRTWNQISRSVLFKRGHRTPWILEEGTKEKTEKAMDDLIAFCCFLFSVCLLPMTLGKLNDYKSFARVSIVRSIQCQAASQFLEHLWFVQLIGLFFVILAVTVAISLRTSVREVDQYGMSGGKPFSKGWAKVAAYVTLISAFIAMVSIGISYLLLITITMGLRCHSAESIICFIVCFVNFGLGCYIFVTKTWVSVLSAWSTADVEEDSSANGEEDSLV